MSTLGASRMRRGFLAALFFLALGASTQAGSSWKKEAGTGWLEWAKGKSAPVARAVRTLIILEPEVLTGIYFPILKRAFSSTEKPEFRDRSRRALDLLRLSQFHQDPTRSQAITALMQAIESDDAEVKGLARSFSEAWARNSQDLEAVKVAAARSTLGIPADLKPLASLYRGRAMHCWAQQKSIQASIEIYALDSNTSPKEINDKVQAAILKQGIFKALPNDPGYGDGSFSHYVLTPRGYVFCLRHAYAFPPKDVSPDTTVRGLLEILGVRNTQILDSAAEVEVVPDLLPGPSPVTP